jgi:hypothetical protein
MAILDMVHWIYFSSMEWNNVFCNLYLFVKQGCLFCIVCQVKISQTTTPHIALVIAFKSS